MATDIAFLSSAQNRVPVSAAQPLPVTSSPSGTAPVAGGITWGAPTAVAIAAH